ncbi:MAG TPA: UDP-3-O-(3-hydroxymyristoyl)glucosamine N-acyltransferase [Candidatus Acidoferrales bacterium]|nr:UDP-3-O-(3-hydroxymyristoyl)glucosamine N-acyltransferase [Candidatus Acidoferrales bacterium]
MTRTLGELAQFLGAKLEGDALIEVTGVASPEGARPDDLIYCDSLRHLDRVVNSAARAVILALDSGLANKAVLRVREPKLAFAKAAAWILEKAAAGASIHPTAVVSSTARIATGVSIGPLAVIEEECRIGANSTIEAFCFIGRGAHLGESCRLHARVTLYPGAHLGNRVEVHSGAVIGSDGFGYVYGEGRHWKFPQIGGVEIGDDAEIGANTTIDRGSLDVTRIATGVKIDNLVQIAHNVQIGEHSVIAAQTGVSGSSSIGARCVVAGQVGIADHCRIEDEAILGAQAGVPTGKTVRSGQTVWGTPARPLERFKEQYAYFARLPELAERLRKLEERE